MEENKNIRTQDEHPETVTEEMTEMVQDENIIEEEQAREGLCTGEKQNTDVSQTALFQNIIPEGEKSAEKKPKGRTFWITAACIVAALVLVFGGFAAYVNNYQEVYPNVYVGELNLGGKTADETKMVLDAYYTTEKLAGKEIAFQCVDARSTILMENMSIRYENDKTTGDVFGYGRSGNLPVKMWSYLTAMLYRKQIDPAISYDTQALAGSINDIAAPYEVEPVGYTFAITEGKLAIFKPTDGVKVDREQITQEVENQIKNYAFGAVVMIPEVTKPPKLDMDAFYAQITADAIDAYYTKVDGHVQVVPEKLKCNIDRQSVEGAVKVIKDGQDSFEMAAETIPPPVTGAMLTQQLYCEKLGSYSTNYGGSSAPRANNVRLAVSRLNGIELMPGEELSYDQTILPRRASNGYKAAPVYVGNKTESGIGGGICQPSSTLYAAALYANLGIVERHNHSMAVSYLPKGMDATIAEGALDLKIKNTTNYPVKINASSDGGVITISILGYNPEKYSVDILRSASGETYYVTRVVKKEGVEVARENMTSSTYQKPAPKEDEKEKEKKKNN